MTFVSDAKLMCKQNCPPSLRGAVRPCGGGCMSDVGGLWLGVGSGGGGEYGGDGDEYDDGGRGWVVCQGICGGAMLEVTTPIICLGLEAII